MLAIEPAVALDVPAEPSLRLLKHALGLTPLSGRRPTGGLGTEPWRVDVDVLLDAVARDLHTARSPVLRALVLLMPIAEQLAHPWRPCRDVALGEVVAHLVHVVIKLTDACLEACALLLDCGRGPIVRCSRSAWVSSAAICWSAVPTAALSRAKALLRQVSGLCPNSMPTRDRAY